MKTKLVSKISCFMIAAFLLTAPLAIAGSVPTGEEDEYTLISTSEDAFLQANRQAVAMAQAVEDAENAGETVIDLGGLITITLLDENDNGTPDIIDWFEILGAEPPEETQDEIDLYDDIVGMDVLLEDFKEQITELYNINDILITEKADEADGDDRDGDGIPDDFDMYPDDPNNGDKLAEDVENYYDENGIRIDLEAYDGLFGDE